MEYSCLLEKLAEQLNFHITYDMISYIDSLHYKDLDADKTNYHVVDGEEGDYGEILYKVGEHLVCRYVNYGGDNEDYNFTKFGVQFFRNTLLRIFDMKILSLGINNE